MTTPAERTRSFLESREFLVKLSTPYNNGFKKIPREVREQARRILRHHPWPLHVKNNENFDSSLIDEFYGVLKEEQDSVKQRPIPENDKTPVYVDPPGGWKYGFPKIYDPTCGITCREWLINNGYPAKILEELGDAFYCRFWKADKEPNSV